MSRATSDDLDAIDSLEQASSTTTWTRSSIAAELAHRDGCNLIVRDADGAAAGYLLGRVIGDATQVLNIVVSPTHRRRGVASSLLEALASMSGTHEVELEVRASNAHAIACYERNGYRETARRPGYYRDPSDDAILMTRPVNATGGGA